MPKINLKKFLKNLNPDESSKSTKKQIPVKNEKVKNPKELISKKKSPLPKKSPLKKDDIKSLKRKDELNKKSIIKESESSLSESESDSENDEIHITVNSPISKPRTPTAFIVNAPRSPISKFDDLTDVSKGMCLADKLKNYRYSEITFILNSDTEEILYVITFDAAGQIVFIEIDSSEIEPVDYSKNIYVSKTNKVKMERMWQESMRSKMGTEIYGIALYNADELITLKRQDNGDIETEYFSSDENIEQSENPHIFPIIKFSEIRNRPLYAIEETKKIYATIQQYQISLNKEILFSLIRSVSQLKDSLVEFDKEYSNNAKCLVDDITTLGDYFSRFYFRYSKQSLDEEDKEKFDSVTLNLLFRYMQFTTTTDILGGLVDIPNIIFDAKEKIDNKTNILKNKTENISNRIIEKDEIEIKL